MSYKKKDRCIACSECKATIQVPEDVIEQEVIACHLCGTEYEYRKGNLLILELDGVDYGE